MPDVAAIFFVSFVYGFEIKLLLNVLIMLCVGDTRANLVEDLAAEEKARAVYENLLNLTTDEDVRQVLLFLRQREIVHFARFKELLEYYEKKNML